MTSTQLTNSDQSIRSEFCSQASCEDNEQIFGTAVSETTIWLALEYPYAWGAKALAECALESDVKSHLENWQEQIPGVRLQMIKRDSLSTSTPDVVYQLPEQEISFFVGLVHEESSRLFRFSLNKYSDLLDIDLVSLISGGGQSAYLVSQGKALEIEDSLYLVCTNGKRDRCCAKWGLPIYHEFADLLPDAAWQTTHIGGHRFAATMVCLPSGVVYGRLQPGEARKVVDADLNGAIYRLDRYRGRSCYNQIVQAAAYYLHRETGSLQLETLRFINLASTEENQWTVRFEATDTQIAHSGNNGKSIHELYIERHLTPKPLMASCGKEPQIAAQFLLHNHRTLTTI
ncbi:hypothetical protein KFU94_04615 [Chloroflexi bacterium TSY]|nr:hypothetical protein [Chloroflexi bacterium TSY]